MPPTTRKAKPVFVEPSVPSKKTTASRKKPPKCAPSESGEGEIPPTIPATTDAPPKKRGRKPKPVTAEAGDLPPQNTADVAGTNPANQPADGTEVSKKIKALVPTRDPLPAREGRNTHPGRRGGVQPSPRRPTQEVTADRERKRLELQAKLQAAEEAKQILARMELEDERLEKAVEEEGRQRVFHPDGQQGTWVVSDDEEFEDLDKVDYSEGEEEDEPEPEPEPEKEGKGKGKGKKQYGLRKEINDKAQVLRGTEKAAGEGAKLSPQDLLPKKNSKPGAAKATMGSFVTQPVIGGLGDEDITVDRPVSFGPISTQVIIPTIPPSLQRDRNRRNNMVGFSLPTTTKGVEDENAGVTQAAVRPHGDVAGDGLNGQATTKKPAVVRPRGNVTGNRLNSQAATKKPAQTKLKIRAVAQHQGANPPVVGAVPVGHLSADFFVLQRTWSKVFLPSLMHLFFVSENPFQAFMSNSPSFILAVQEAFNASYPNISFTVTAQDAIVTTAFERLKSKRSLIASDVMKLIKQYFADVRFTDQSKEVKIHVWWALRPDGPAYHAKPTPIGCPFDRTSPEYINPEGKYQSKFMVPIAKKYLAFADASAIFPKIGVGSPPLGLYTLILTAVERGFKSFALGSYNEPPPFSNDNVWRSMEVFCRSLLRLDVERWGRILAPLELREEGHVNFVGLDDFDLSTLSAYRDDIADLTSPVKG